MRRVLITGMSGTGKSTLIERLSGLGYKAVDLDSHEFSEWVDVDPATDPLTPAPGKDWVWRKDRVQELLSIENAGMLIVSGCAENMGQFLPQFDQVILLSASPAIIVKRLAARTNNPYGKQPGELAQVLAIQQIVEPLLREVADHEIDTGTDIDIVMGNLLDLLKIKAPA